MRKILLLVLIIVFASCEKEVIKEVIVEVPEIKQEVEVKFHVKTTDPIFSLNFADENGNMDLYVTFIDGETNDLEFSERYKEDGLLYLFLSTNRSSNELNLGTRKQASFKIYVNGKLLDTKECFSFGENMYCSWGGTVPTIEEIELMD